MSMTTSHLGSSNEAVDPLDQMNTQACTLHVCTSCRPPGSPRWPEESRPGFVLYKELVKAIEARDLRHKVEIRAAECLSICPRPCGLALSSPGSWTYLFGDQQPSETAMDVVECVSLYLKSPDGFMARNERPKSFRGSILGRVPPLTGVGECI